MGARFLHVLTHQFVDVSVQRGGEQQRLTTGAYLVEEFADLRHEAHVAHLVGLVQNRDLDIAEVAHALLDQVAQSPGRGDQNVDPPAQFVDLSGVGTSTHHIAHPDAEDTGVATQGIPCLVGQFPGGNQDQRLRAAGFGAAPGGAHQDRQAEGQGLARTRAAAAEDVQTVERIGDGRGLDRERAGHTVLGQFVDDVLGKTEVIEGRRYGSVRQVTCTFLIVWQRFEEGFTGPWGPAKKSHKRA